MTWFSSLGAIEIIFVLSFIALYLLYIIRVVRLAGKLNTSYGRLFYKVFVRTIYFALFIVALLGPSFGQSSKEVRSVGKDIMIAIDLSESMRANDIAPTRLEKVKYELKNLVDAFSSDRIGIVIFSSEAFIQCPLTYDQNALYLFIETLNTGLVPNTGTDFAPALGLALDKLENNEGSSLDQKSKVLVLISDGEDFGDETGEIANKIRERDIRLYTLGIGTERGSKIQTRNGFKKDQNGADVVTKLNSESLRNLASKTGGKYFEINESTNDIKRLINTLSNIEGELRDTRQVDVSANKYYYFLAAALFLLLLDGFTSLKTIRL
jgi:Ca-activated chloride channel family protein